MEQPAMEPVEQPVTEPVIGGIVMKKNVGFLDQKVRAYVLAPILAIVGIVALALSWPVWVPIVAFVLAAVMLVTGVSRTCPIYSVVQVTTVEKPPESVGS